MTAISSTHADVHAAGSGVTFGRVLHSEWIKLRSLRSTVILLACTAAAMAGLGMLAAWGATLAAGEGQPVGEQDLHGTITGGLAFGQLVLGSLAILLISAEYGTGMIRSTMITVPRRIPAVLAKAAVIALVSYVAGTVSAFATYFAVQPVLGPDGMGFVLDSAVLGSILCTGLYLSLVALMGLALGTLLRNSAGSIVTLSALLLVVPMALSMIPGELFANISKYLPSNAGAQLTATRIADGSLTQLQGGLVMAVWAVVPLIIALAAIKRRDV
ncbi:ABC transporter permease [Arthrobacter sp. GCM10027362]|uniref:ABC transporter permease n=1 Tax=Arthrobacter sp. GCM10027362 TaxID=3273379 RepID=UPI0036276B97